MQDRTQFLNEAQLCERLGIAARTAQRWRVTGEGPAWTRLGVRRVGYSEASVATWEASRTFAHRAGEIAGQVAA